MIRSLVILVLFCFVLRASAANYWVDVTNAAASDSNSGTAEEPWLTIAKATATATAGDTVTIQPGTYNEWVTNTASGTAGNPITFTGVRGSAGEWLTIIDPSSDFSTGWSPASEIGSGVYKKTGMSFDVYETTLTNRRLANVYTMGTLASIGSAYSTGPTSGSGFLSLSSTSNLTTLWNDNQVVAWWDSVQALWGFSSDGTKTQYLRIRDGSDPSGWPIRASSGGTVLTITGAYQVYSNLWVRGDRIGAHITGSSAHHNTIASNYFTAGYNSVLLTTNAYANSILFNESFTDYHGLSDLGAWSNGTNSDYYGNRMNVYLVSKYIMTSQVATDDERISLDGAGATNVIAWNNIHDSIGLGISMSTLGEYPIITNTVIASNTIANHSSVGILCSGGHTYTKIFHNHFSDNGDANIRMHRLGIGGETNRVIYAYRNTCWQPDDVSVGIFFHWTNPDPDAYNQELWFYHNSFSGGFAGMSENGSMVGSFGLTNSTFLNNIFSDSIYFYSSDSQWVSTNVMGLFDYNVVTPPYRTYPSADNPEWFAVNNIKQTTNVWTNVEGMSFAITTNSQAFEAGIDIPTTYPTLPQDSTVKYGDEWDIGALEFNPGGQVQSVIFNVQNLYLR